MSNITHNKKNTYLTTYMHVAIQQNILNQHVFQKSPKLNCCIKIINGF